MIHTGIDKKLKHVLVTLKDVLKFKQKKYILKLQANVKKRLFTIDGWTENASKINYYLFQQLIFFLTQGKLYFLFNKNK